MKNTDAFIIHCVPVSFTTLSSRFSYNTSRTELDKDINTSLAHISDTYQSLEKLHVQSIELFQ